MFPKYIIVQIHPSCLPYGITFPPWENHSDMARCVIGDKNTKTCILGAGEFSIGLDDKHQLAVTCFGRSDTLGIESRHDDDAIILQKSLYKELY